MPSEQNQLCRSNHRAEKTAFIGFLFCIGCSVALILTAVWGMVRLDLTTAEIFFGSLLTFTLATLLTGGGAVAYALVKSQPEPVKVLASRAPSRESR